MLNVGIYFLYVMSLSGTDVSVAPSTATHPLVRVTLLTKLYKAITY